MKSSYLSSMVLMGLMHNVQTELRLPDYLMKALIIYLGMSLPWTTPKYRFQDAASFFLLLLLYAARDLEARSPFMFHL